jgi:hypothetical protein
MIVVLNHEGYFISRLHEPSEEDLARPDVFEAPESDMLNNQWKLVDGAWVAPPVVEPELGAIVRPPRSVPA